MPMAAMMTAQGMAMPRILGRTVDSTSCPKKKLRKITTACHSHSWMCDSCRPGPTPPAPARAHATHPPKRKSQCAAAAAAAEPGGPRRGWRRGGEAAGNLLHDVIDEELVAGQLGEAEGEVELVDADDEGDADGEALHHAQRDELRALVELEQEDADADEARDDGEEREHLLAVANRRLGQDPGKRP